MLWFDWLIVIVPLVFVLCCGIFCRRYAKDVTAFVSSGRCCGRYVILVGDVAEAMSILGLIAYVEVHYRTGYATSFWIAILTPIAIIMSLFGYCNYRMRETKAQSLGQYLEMRYGSRSMRVYAAVLRTFSEVFANMIMPALAARFFIYFLDLPRSLIFFGLSISTFHLVMLIVLTLAISIICAGGSVAINITDTIQGFFCYPMLVIMVCFVLSKFSWSNEILPVLEHRVEGESMINPYDVYKLRDFNLFSIIILPLVTRFIHRLNWFGGGSSSTAARSAHEQKMAGLLGTWRGSLGSMFYLTIAIAIITLLNHQTFREQAHKIRLELTTKVAQEVVENPVTRQTVIANIKKLPLPDDVIGVTEKFSDKKNIDSRYLETGHQAMIAGDVDHGHAMFQKFRTLYYQLMLPVTLRNMLPNGLLGVFCVLMILLMVSTDDSRIFSSAVTISQDILLPLIKKPLTPNQHIWMLRWVSICVGVIFFIGSSFMSQLDYINLFVTIVTIMWTGGAGPVMVLGLYTRFGTAAGAWTSLITGMVMGVGGVIVQRNWPETVYPMLRDAGVLEYVENFLVTVSKPFNPIIVWEMNPVKCPINSYEWAFITVITTLLLYCVVSKLTCKEPFNLERMLHRGKYSLGEVKNIKSPWSWGNLYNKLVGITPEYTRGDKIIAWGYLCYSLVYRFGCTFIVTIIWNAISPWPVKYWGWYCLITFLIVPGTMACITTFWFTIGGLLDLKRMFHDLENRVVNYLDDGRVEGTMSLADKAALEAVDKVQPQKAEK